jgi:arylsulfatase A-like enzyme/Flp pilus assembly protein TadD
MSKRHQIAALLILATSAIALCGTLYCLIRDDRLNVILITLDTTRADRLKAYGYQEGQTSELDKYAQKGVVFERAYAPAPITLPSHATILTGLYPPEHGLRVNGQGGLSKEIPLLSEILHDHQYQTAAFVSAAVLDSTFGLNRGFDIYDDFASQRVKKKKLSRQRRPGRDVVDSALSWLKSSTDKPFFCWVHLFDAHAPYDSRPSEFGGEFETNPYDAGIAYELKQVERITTWLREHQLQDRTLVIIAADHGEGLGEHRETEHGMLAYNSTLRVPLIFVGTRYCRPATRVAATVSLVDIAPTVLDILGFPPAPRASGRSLRLALSGGDIPARPCYAEAESPFAFNRWCPLHVLISDDWKYIHTKFPELYNLKDDPREQRNLADIQGGEAKDQRFRLEEIEQSFATFKPQKVTLDQKQINELNALGYTGMAVKGNSELPIDIQKLTDVKEMLPQIEKFEEAKRLSLQGNVDSAIALAREIEQQIGPAEYLESSYLLGDCLIASNRPDEAIEVFMRILETHPEIEHTHFRLATAFLKQGNYEQAEIEFRQMAQHEANSAIIHGELARVLVRLKKSEDAVTEYRKALQLEPGSASTNVELGQLLLKLNRLSDAKKCFEEAIRIDPHEGVAQATLLKVYVQLGEYPRALELARTNVRLDPNAFETRFNLAVLLITLNRYEEGLNELREAQRRFPNERRITDLINQTESALKRLQK